MSRSAEPARRSVPGAVAALLVVGGLLVPGVSAAQTPGPVVDVVAPPVTIVAPVLDISFGESDLERQTRVEQLPRRTTITLDSTVLFARDSAKLTARARGRLDDVGQRLADRGPGAVRITGYTDDLGSAAYGRALSRRRAAAVAGVLRRSLPAGEYPFDVVGRGEADPAVPNTSEANRKVNRRVVLLYRRR